MWAKNSHTATRKWWSLETQHSVCYELTSCLTWLDISLYRQLTMWKSHHIYVCMQESFLISLFDSFIRVQPSVQWFWTILMFFGENHHRNKERCKKGTGENTSDLKTHMEDLFWNERTVTWPKIQKVEADGGTWPFPGQPNPMLSGPKVPVMASTQPYGSQKDAFME